MRPAIYAFLPFHIQCGGTIGSFFSSSVHIRVIPSPAAAAPTNVWLVGTATRRRGEVGLGTSHTRCIIALKSALSTLI